MPLVNEVYELGELDELGYDRVGRLRSYEVSVGLNKQHAFLHHRVKAYLELMKGRTPYREQPPYRERSLYYHSISPAYALFIPYAWFSAVRLDYRTERTGGYLEVASWSVLRNLDIFGVFSLYDLWTGSLILDTAIGLSMKEHMDINEIVYSGNGNITLLRLLPQLLL